MRLQYRPRLRRMAVFESGANDSDARGDHWFLTSGTVAFRLNWPLGSMLLGFKTGAFGLFRYS